MDKKKHEALELLKKIKAGKSTLPSKDYDFSHASLVGEDLSGLNLSSANFSHADLTGAKLSKAQLFKANFEGANLNNANLQEAELSGANLTAANLEGITAKRAGFGMALLKKALLFRANLEGATLSMANLENADLRNAFLKGARIREASLKDADLTNANLRNVDLALTKVAGASFNNSDLRGSKLRLITDFKQAEWMGVDIRDINFSGAYQLRRYIIDENYIKEFRMSSRLSAIIYYFWWLSSDCGRSFFRWCFWLTFQAFAFAFIYHFITIDFGPYPTAFSPLYFSIVTLTTLGYGDAIPATLLAQLIVVLEVTTGYVMLGGLLSILNNKLSRRAD